MVTYRIAFPLEHLDLGLGLILGAGPGAFTERRDEFVVTELALRVLNDYQVPYRVVEGPKRYGFSRPPSRD